MAKGSSFERWAAKRLSLWWTQDEDPPRDDVFWRTDGSGARATARAKRGKGTSNSCGDIGILDPCGQPLLDLIAFELKRGYSRYSVQDLLDHNPAKGGKPEYLKWIEKAERVRQAAGAYSWMLIVKRDQKLPLVIYPNELNLMVATPNWPGFTLRIKDEKDCWTQIKASLLEDWLEVVRPEMVIKAVAKLRKRRA